MLKYNIMNKRILVGGEYSASIFPFESEKKITRN
jgi:hypothetical protein